MSTGKFPEHKKRTLLLSDRISQGSVKSIMDSILEINEDDSEKEEIYFVVINDSSKRRELIKNIPKFCGVFCNSNAFGLGQVTQIFRYPSDCHKKRINIIKRFKALLIRN